MYRKDFEKIDTKEKAYVLGLFYADGCTSFTDKNNIHSRISLHYLDDYLLKDIQKYFPYFKFYKAKMIHKRNNSTLYSGSRAFNKDLIKLGCLPSKSIVNKEFLKMPIINNEFIGDFIRGVFDGDGGCTLTINKPKIQKRVYIYSNSEKFIKELSECLTTLNIYNSIKSNSQSNSNLIYKLTISTKSYKDFYNLIYKEPSLFLVRKLEKFNEILKYKIFIAEKNILNCICCNSFNTVKNGFEKYKDFKTQRYLCKNCKKVFTAPINSDINRVEFQPNNFGGTNCANGEA